MAGARRKTARHARLRCAVRSCNVAPLSWECDGGSKEQGLGCVCMGGEADTVGKMSSVLYGRQGGGRAMEGDGGP
jgi:hypothetical protein